MSDETVKALERRAEATGDPADARKALVERARAGDEKAREELADAAREAWEAERRAKPVGEWTPTEILAVHHLPYGGTETECSRYHAHEERRETLEDEVSEARAMARRGEAPRPTWKPNVVGPKLDAVGAVVGHETAPDPRLSAWREAAWKRIKSASRAMGGWLPDEAPDLEGLSKIENDGGSAGKYMAQPPEIVLPRL